MYLLKVVADTYMLNKKFFVVTKGVQGKILIFSLVWERNSCSSRKSSPTFI